MGSIPRGHGTHRTTICNRINYILYIHTNLMFGIGKANPNYLGISYITW